LDPNEDENNHSLLKMPIGRILAGGRRIRRGFHSDGKNAIKLDITFQMVGMVYEAILAFQCRRDMMIN
jgi:hypothetical protein